MPTPLKSTVEAVITDARRLAPDATIVINAGEKNQQAIY